MRQLSRREFGAIVAGGAMAGAVADPFAIGQRASGPTAEAIVDRIRGHIGVAWNEQTVDTFKAGDPATVVTGVATTAMATVAVLKAASAAGANLVISCEPTFYGRADARMPPVGRRGGRAGGAATAGGPNGAPPAPPDPIYTAKNELIDGNNLVVFRLNEHWRQHEPNPFVAGLAETLGLEADDMVGEVRRFRTQPATLEAFVGDVKRKLGSRGGLRVVGDRQARISRVALLPGSTPITDALEALPHVDAIVAGEVREWESVEYARDVAFAGQGKALVLVGRIVSEDPGMNACAAWLKTLVTEVPVRHVAAGDPYWRPTR